MSNLSRFESIRNAVADLNDNNPEHWNDYTNAPNPRAVATLCGGMAPDITQAECNRYGRIRKVAQPEQAQRAQATPPAPLTVEQALKTFDASLATVNAARERKAMADSNVKTKRASLADSVIAWQKLFRVTPEANIRAHIASENEMRRKIATGEIEQAQTPRVANSRIDQMNVGARSRGYTSAYKRGGMTQTEIAVRRAQATRQKLPSER